MHLQRALERHKQEKLYAKLKKCEFWMDEVSFLGHVVSGEGVLMDPSKVKVVVEWERQTNVQEIMDKAHRSLNTVQLGSTKMYKYLKETYWWNNMKRNIAKYVKQCLTCQQVKEEH